MKTFTQTLAVGATALAVGMLSGSRSARAAAFTAGDLVVDRVGTGSAALSSASTAVFLNEYTISGTAVQSIALATDGTSVTQSGSASSEGLLHFAADGSSLLVPGYNVATGIASVASATSSAAPRAIAEFSLNGTQASITQLGSAFSGNNFRSATGSSASTLFGAGAITGILSASAGTNGSTTVSSTSTNNRDVNVFGGNLYFTTQSGTAGLYEITGTPTAAGQTAALVAAASSPNGFSVSSDNLTAYVANSTSLTKYTRTSAAGIFSAAYSLAIPGSVTGLAVSYGATNTVYFDSPTTIYASVDSGSSFGTAATLDMAATNTAFRGLDIVPVPEPATVFGGLLLVGALGWNQRCWLRGMISRRRMSLAGQA